MSPHAAARMAAAHRTEAQHAYSAADENALENFVLGWIPTAVSTAWVELQDWAEQVNEQMRLTAASSGAGVQIELALRRDLPPSIATIHHLTCKIGDAGPGSRRADRLAEAIDIRTWVTVKYMITGPGTPRQERWGARGVTVSKGESRLIPRPGGIAAYLATLDLDLMSTSHNWDGSPGAWDGIDIFELEKAPEDTVIAFPVRVHSPLLQQATGHLDTSPAGTS